MHRRRKILSAALAVGLAFGIGQLAGPSSAGTAAALSSLNTHRRDTVTLLTGDQVSTLGTGRPGAKNEIVVTPAKGREKITFAIFHAKGHLHVIPQDAIAMVGAGVLDSRLFDVTLLTSLGYDDTHRATLPLIVGYAPGGAQKSAPTIGVAAGTVTRDLPAIHGAAIQADKSKGSTLWSALTTTPSAARTAIAAGVAHVWLDGRRQPALDQSVPQIGAPAAWAAGFTGAGVSVAVLDTGIDATHPDLAGAVVDEHNFTADPNPADTVGHGTHVASTITGSGAASGGRYKGVAPDATLYDGKVCESFGCDESAILAGMSWAAADKHARVVNISLGGGDTADIDPLEAAVNSLTAQYGTLFVIAAGNSGPDGSTVSSPGSADAALTVGAVDKSDQLAYFSSRGPRIGDDAVKPDITAPGVDIVAAKGVGTQLGEPIGDAYVKLSGTSMATPHVAGSAAILAQQHPAWTAGQLKAALMASAKPNPANTGYEQGAGRVDLARAITQPVTSDPASLSLGRQTWPHTDDTPIVRTLTYQNTGSTDLNLSLAAAVTGPGGQAVPAGMFTFSANSVSVPAGGTAQVTLTADTRVTGPDGLYSGQIIATGGSVQVSTPVGINREAESYDLTLSHVDRSGAPSANYFSVLSDMDTGRYFVAYDPSGTVTMHLPKGHYDLFSFVDTFDANGFGTSTLLSQPVLDLIANTSISLDARLAGPVRVSLPDATAQAQMVELGYDHSGPGGFTVGAGVFSGSADGIFTGFLGATVPGTDYAAHASSQWATPGPDGTTLNSPTIYLLMAYQYGRLYTGYDRTYRTSDLGKMREEYASVLPGQLGDTGAFAFAPGSSFGISVSLPISLPVQRTAFYSADSGVVWNRELLAGTPTSEGWIDYNTFLSADQRSFRAGEDYEDQWNSAPFGPSLSTDYPSVVRFGDVIGVGLPMFSDRAGHFGDSLTDTGTTTLYFNGAIVDQSSSAGFAKFMVPAATGTYRLVVEATRSVFTDLTTSIRTEWTFRSGHVGDTAVTPLPVIAVRTTPELENNAAPAGQTLRIPVVVQTQSGTQVLPIRSLTVEVSYNDGRTWQTAKVQHGSDGWFATVTHPRSGGYVSLRITARDSAGSSVSQTVIHAYRLVLH